MNLLKCSAIVLLFVAHATWAESATQSCSAPEYRQFDFWMGAWDVYNPQGKKVGENHITVEQGGCVLHEYWVSINGGTGESFNMFDRTRGIWHQTWVSAQGVLLLLEGGLNEAEEMVFSGPGINAKGVYINRITWSKQTDGSVRQHWEISSNGGKQWKTVFDGLYRRQNNG